MILGEPLADEALSLKENKLLLQNVMQNNMINYEELNKYSNEIISGKIYINRLLLAEESGRLQEAQAMLKHPLSLQQMKQQTQQNKMSLKEQHTKGL